MAYKTWDEIFYTSEEFAPISKKLNAVNRNHRLRCTGKRFAEFVNAGSDALLRDNPDFVAHLI